MIATAGTDACCFYFIRIHAQTDHLPDCSGFQAQFPVPRSVGSKGVLRFRKITRYGAVDRNVYLIAAGADCRACGSMDILINASQNIMHLFHCPGNDASGNTPPSRVNHSSQVQRFIIENNRQAISSEYRSQQGGVFQDEGICFFRSYGRLFIQDAAMAAVNLFSRNKGLSVHRQSPAELLSVAENFLFISRYMQGQIEIPAVPARTAGCPGPDSQTVHALPGVPLNVVAVSMHHSPIIPVRQQRNKKIVSGEQKVYGRGMLKRFISYYRPHRKLFILDMIIAVSASALSILSPMITHRLLSVYLPDHNRGKILESLAVILAIYMIISLFNYIRIKWGHILGVRIEYDMRSDLFRHLQKLSFSWYDNTKTGHIMSRITGDLESIAEIAHHAPEDFLISICVIFGAYSFMFVLNPLLAVISLVPLPLMLLWGIRQGGFLKSQFRKVRAKIADINAAVENTVMGIREVKSYANEPWEIRKFDTTNDHFRSAKEKAYSRMARFHSVIGFLREIYYFVVIAGGVILISRDLLSAAELVAFLLYVGIILPPIDRLINFVEQYSQGAAAFDRFMDIMRIQPDIEDREDAVLPPEPEGRIEMKQVSFSYESSHQKVLQDISLTVSPGETVALVGESGAGKSTLVALLPRFYEPQKGDILVDGYGVSQVKQYWLRENIGLVQQNVFLFDTTIRDNICYGKPDASDEDIRQAAEAAHIWDFITTLPEGLDTLVGERGVKLSGGQKQRVAIARVFLKNPRILIFDEATSSLDSESEAYIQQSMKELCKGRTAIVIAHRLSTVKEAQRLYVMREGRIVEEGTHDELLGNQGYYSSLYKKNLL